MTAITIDASAWIELFEGTNIGKQVQNYLDSNEAVTPSIVIAEVCSAAKRKGIDADAAFHAMSTSTVVHLTPELARKSGILHAQLRRENSKFSLGDAVVLATARQLNAKILTKDSDFRDFPEAIVLK